MPRRPLVILLSIPLIGLGSSTFADDAWRLSGFAFARVSSAPATGPLEAETLSAQAHLGVDWSPSPYFLAHVHLLARSDDEESRRGTAGIVQAYVEGNLQRADHRIRLRGGAFFLPTSRENVDALWETPYTLTPSALNSWLGEEFRPVGIDATYVRYGVFAGATLFSGNDTFGALPPVRGWRMYDHWTLLGEWIPINATFFTSVSAENDQRLGWSGRIGWNGEHAFVQFTHIDNRSDALRHGQLSNWDTRFDIAAIEYSTDDWTIAGEHGWGPTIVIGSRGPFRSDLQASYLLASRRFRHGRATLRADWFSAGDVSEQAITAAFLWSPPGPLRPGIEVIRSGGETRLSAEVRYMFSSH